MGEGTHIQNDRCTLTEDQELMGGLQQDQNPPEQVFGNDVVLDMVGVMLYAECQELQYQAQQLCCLVIVWWEKEKRYLKPGGPLGPYVALSLTLGCQLKMSQSKLCLLLIGHVSVYRGSENYTQTPMRSH